MIWARDLYVCDIIVIIMSSKANIYLNLFDSETGDVAVQLKDERLHLHSAILKQVPIFNSSLDALTENGLDLVLNLTEYDISIKEFLKYLYTSEVPEDLNGKISIYYFAKVFCTDNELNSIKQHILDICDDETVCDLINLSEKLDVGDVLEYCVNYLVNNIRKHCVPCFDSYKCSEISLGVVKDRRFDIPHCCKHFDFNNTDKYKHKDEFLLKAFERDEQKPCMYYTLRKFYKKEDQPNILLDQQLLPAVPNHPDQRYLKKRIPMDTIFFPEDSSPGLESNDSEEEVVANKELVLPDGCETKLCCTHRKKYTVDFISKVSDKVKDTILTKLTDIE